MITALSLAFAGNHKISRDLKSHFHHMTHAHSVLITKNMEITDSETDSRRPNIQKKIADSEMW
jgi:hypothetical protein